MCCDVLCPRMVRIKKQKKALHKFVAYSIQKKSPAILSLGERTLKSYISFTT